MLTSISACVFDAYGTLFDVRSTVDRCKEQLGDQAALLATLWRTKQLEYSWQRSLRGDYEDFWHVTGDALDHALSTCGINDLLLRSRLMEGYLALDAFVDARSCLEAIKKKGLRTAILSNGSPSMLTAVINASRFSELIDSVLSVDSLRVYKPHPDVYRLAVEQLKFNEEKICFVSANGWDVSGAARFGFRVVWINRSKMLAENLPGNAEHEISSLNELPSLISTEAV